jgi:pimeloyl-ACP methyl ester carboxylesterase
MSNSSAPFPAAQGNAATAGFLNTDWNPRDLPAGVSTRNVVLRTMDGAATGGSLYVPDGARTVVCIMHPREFMACHYLIPDIVACGAAAWTQSPRSVGNDLRLEHEFSLHDVAAGLSFLKEQGFERIVLLGNSGGSGLYSFYIQQSVRAPGDRIAVTPGGRKTNLAELVMPLVDELILVAPHPGQGELLLRCIDPSVTDENDPFSSDPALDPFSAENGFVESPASASYSSAFVERYRQAQVARVQRLDDHARSLIAARLAARKRYKETGSTTDRRLGSLSPIMTIWRTDADLRNYDLSIDRSDRKYGSLWGKDPFVSNWGSVGFGRLCSPESWLSTWSGLSSNALLSKTAPEIKLPVLLIEYTADPACFPAVVKQIYDALGTEDKQHVRIRGDHHGRALAAGEEPGRYQAGKEIQRWLQRNGAL